MQQDVCVDFKDHKKVAKPKQGLQKMFTSKFQNTRLCKRWDKIVGNCDRILIDL